MEEEMARLKQELKATHDNMVKAATFGQALMQQNDDLRKEMEEKTQDHSKKMEVKNQEIHSLQQRVDRYAKSEEWLKEEVENLKQAVATQKAEVQEQVLIAKQEAALLRYKIEQLEQELETEMRESAQLRERVEQLEELLDEQHNTTCPASRTQDMTELEALQQENQALGSELTMQKARFLDVQSELKLSKQKMEAGQVWADNQAREIEELNCQITSYMNALEKSRLERMEVQAQMDALRLEAGDHKHKGNSLFAELDDRRVAAEKKVITQQSLQEMTQQKLEMERQQNQKLKMRLMMLLQMDGKGADMETVEKLRTQLVEARAEVNHLVEESRQRQLEEAKLADRLASLGKGQSDSDKQYCQYLITIINSKEKKVVELQKEVKGLQLQVLAHSNADLEQGRRLQELEAERKKFHAQAMKLALKNEELLLKYDPDQVKCRQQVLRGIKEKIPLGEVEDSVLDFSLAMSSSSSARTSSSTLSVATSSSLAYCTASTSVLQPSMEADVSKCEGIPGLDLSYGPLTAGKPPQQDDDILRDATNEVKDTGSAGMKDKEGRKRGVAMCGEVQVCFEDGHQETATLADADGHGGAKPSRTKENSTAARHKGRVVRNVKNVGDQPVNECKAQ